MSSMAYRADIDGLRALAVAFVLLFHGGLGLPGGYIGVDVFFVISGYLITGLILADLENGDFDYRRFLVRRIRRLLPASLVMVLAVLAAGYFLLLPDDYTSLAESAIAQQLMAANVYFWRKMGYFDGPAELKPLLHTWSLGVEEQFYLLYPLLLWLLRTKGTVARAALLGSAACGSFILNQLTLPMSPSSAFYLLPMRAWELLLGGLCVLIPRPTKSDPRVWNAASWLGMLTLVICALSYTNRTPFPGFFALIPCVAACCLLYAHSVHPSGLCRLLSTRPAVAIGAISYSLYLWHWPLVVYARYIEADRRLGFWWFQVIYFAFSFVLAVLSWRYVEQPFRRRQTSNALFLPAAAGIVAAVLLTGMFIRLQGGIPGRLPTAVREVTQPPYCTEVTTRNIEHDDVPTWRFHGGEELRIAVWGDSHAMSLMAGVLAACRQRPTTCFQLTHSDTPPLVGFDSSRQHKGQHPPDFGPAVIRFCARHRVDMVFMCASWAKYAETAGFEAGLHASLSGLREAGIRAVLVEDYPWGAELAPRFVLSAAIFGEDLDRLGVPLQLHRDRNAKASAALRHHAAESCWVRDPTAFFVNDQGVCHAVVHGKSLYVDKSHLSVAGGLITEPFFLGLLDQALEAQ